MHFGRFAVVPAAVVVLTWRLWSSAAGETCAGDTDDGSLLQRAWRRAAQLDPFPTKAQEQQKTFAPNVEAKKRIFEGCPRDADPILLAVEEEAGSIQHDSRGKDVAMKKGKPHHCEYGCWSWPRGDEDCRENTLYHSFSCITRRGQGGQSAQRRMQGGLPLAPSPQGFRWKKPSEDYPVSPYPWFNVLRDLPDWPFGRSDEVPVGRCKSQFHEYYCALDDGENCGSLGSARCVCHPLWEITLEEDTPAGIKETCCPVGATYCGGCARAGDSGCEQCMGGYTLLDGHCVQCVDTPGWTDIDGQTCYDLQENGCEDKPYRGLSSNQACCKCGGGHRAATAFMYVVQPLVLFAQEVYGQPVPRTASRYSVNPECQLAKYGLTINGSTGALELTCDYVGCFTKAEPFEVQCTITAHQIDGELNSTTTLSLQAFHLAYESQVLLTTDTHPLRRAPGNEARFPLLNDCLTLSRPSKKWSLSYSCTPNGVEGKTRLLESDTLEVQPLAQGLSGVTDLGNSSGQTGQPGGACVVEGTWAGAGGKRPASFKHVLLGPQPWTSFDYDLRRVYATVGARARPLHVRRTKDGALPPARFSAACRVVGGPDLVFDKATGVGTVAGHTVFFLDVLTGSLRVEPSAGLHAVFDAQTEASAIRRELVLSCAVFGHYELSALGHDPSVRTSVEIRLNDPMCWFNTTAYFYRVTEAPNLTTAAACRGACRANPTCSHYLFEAGTCAFPSDRCVDADLSLETYGTVTGASSLGCRQVDAVEKVKDCGERRTCLALRWPGHWDFSGKYCPLQDSGVLGQVFRRESVTAYDVKYLVPYDPVRDAAAAPNCSRGQYVLRQADSMHDFLDLERHLAEFNGAVIGCIDLSVRGDLIASVFRTGGVNVSVNSSTSEGVSVGLFNKRCPALNISSATRKAREDAGEAPGEDDGFESPSPLVVNDPSTKQTEDHWLHPCECFPLEWGTMNPVQEDSYLAVPAGSGNQFRPKAQLIVRGEFVCEPEADGLIETRIIMSEEFEAECEETCKEAAECRYYFAGRTGESSQCRLYSKCTVLVREPGLEGALKGMAAPGERLCHIADPDRCFQASGRRQLLGGDVGAEIAGDPLRYCKNQALFHQCDLKLLNQQMGVQECGRCTFSSQPMEQWQHKRPMPEREHGHRLEVGCWEERFVPLPASPGEKSGVETVTCVSGEWVDATGSPSLGRVSCGACVQVTDLEYRKLQSEVKEELFFTELQEVEFFIVTSPPQKIGDDGALVPAPIARASAPGTETKPLIYGDLRSGIDEKQTCVVEEKSQLLSVKGDTTITLTEEVQPSTLKNGTTYTATLTELEKELFVKAQGFFMSRPDGNGVYYIPELGVPVAEVGSDDSNFQAVVPGLAEATKIGYPNADSKTTTVEFKARILSFKLDGVKKVFNSEHGTGDVDVSELEFGKRVEWTMSSSVVVPAGNTTETVTVEVKFMLSVKFNENERRVDWLTLGDCARSDKLNLGWNGNLLQTDEAPPRCVAVDSEYIFYGAQAVVLAECDNSSKQLWQFDDRQEGELQLVNYTNRVLSVDGETFQLRVDDAGEHGGAVLRGTGSAFPSSSISSSFRVRQWQLDFFMSQQDCRYTLDSGGATCPSGAGKCGGAYIESLLTIRSFPTGSGDFCPFPYKACDDEDCPLNEGQPGGFVLEHIPEAAIGVKLARSTQDPSKCLQLIEAQDDRFEMRTTHCDPGDETQQLDLAVLPARLWNFAREDAVLPRDTVSLDFKFSGVSQRFVSDLQTFSANCPDGAVLSGFGWNTTENEEAVTGFSTECALAATLGAPRRKDVYFPRGDHIKARADGLCLTTSSGSVITAEECDEGAEEQRFYWAGKKLKVEGTDLCLGVQDDESLALNCSAKWTNWKLDDRNRLSVDSKRLCLVRGSNAFETAGCTGSTSQKFTIGTGARGLPAGKISCPGAQVVASLEVGEVKSRPTLTYSCVALAAIGECLTVDSPTVEVADRKLDSLADLTAYCGPMRALKKVIGEYSAGGEWVRYKMTCCHLTEPSSIVPVFRTDKASGLNWPSLITRNLSALEGVYCPYKVDGTGRPSFRQRSFWNQSAASAATPSQYNTLTFDQLKGAWCINADQECVTSGIGHPLDLPLRGSTWDVLPIQDLIHEPEARGVSKPPKTPRKPPRLIQFAATQPEFAEECQDEVTPGQPGFSVEKMNEIGLGLNAENPCSQVAGDPEDGDTTSRWQEWSPVLDQSSAGFLGEKLDQLNDEVTKALSKALGLPYKEDETPWNSGTTYSTVRGCGDREIARGVEAANLAAKSDFGSAHTALATHGVNLLCGLLPDAWTGGGIGVMAGAEWNLAEICSDAADTISMGVDYNFFQHPHISGDQQLALKDSYDCSSLQHGMSRIFCDLHCLRDSVRRGDEAILKSLTRATNVNSENTRMLMDYYTNVILDRLDTGGAGLVQIDEAQATMSRLFQEMNNWTSQDTFDPRSSAVMLRALDTYTSRLESMPLPSGGAAEDAARSLAELVSQTQHLHATMHHASRETLAKSAVAERRVHSYVKGMQSRLEEHAKMLGVYAQRGVQSKQRQRLLFSKVEPRLRDVVWLVEHQATETLLWQLDSTWWDLRALVDDFLDGTSKMNEAFGTAVEMLQDYTSQCSMEYPQLLKHYRAAVDAENSAHDSLRDTWRKMLPLLGKLAATITDEDALNRLARSDLIDIVAQGGNISAAGDGGVMLIQAVCRGGEHADASVRQAVEGAVESGLWGQTVRQLTSLAAEVTAMSNRYSFGGMGGAPHKDIVAAAMHRLASAIHASSAAMPDLVKDATSLLKKQC